MEPVQLPRALTGHAYYYKLACDGYDFSKTATGEAMLNQTAMEYVRAHCVIRRPFDAEKFVANCRESARSNPQLLEGYVSAELAEKYEVGFFQPRKGAVSNSDYVLFNDAQLDEWKMLSVDLYELRFAVCVSRDETGSVNELGLRLLNQEAAGHAFKWLFPYGQRATFGLDKADYSQPVEVMEGFRDYIAMSELGRNAIALGSVIPNDYQLAKINAFPDHSICFDNDSFGKQRALELMEAGHKIKLMTTPDKDAYEAWLAHGDVSFLAVA